MRKERKRKKEILDTQREIEKNNENEIDKKKDK